jgi:hypothetical protein
LGQCSFQACMTEHAIARTGNGHASTGSRLGYKNTQAKREAGWLNLA